jgi:hypothetical protein
MMSSASSTKPARVPAESGFKVWHFYFILSMAGATWAVVAARQTHPAALLLLSAAILAAGLAGAAMHYALAGFFGVSSLERAPLADSARVELLREKALLLRSIKELDFDHSMGKVSDADLAEIGGRMRTRAVAILEELERDAASRAATPAAPRAAARASLRAALCPSCKTANDLDARFCKQCGARL